MTGGEGRNLLLTDRMHVQQRCACEAQHLCYNGNLKTVWECSLANLSIKNNTWQRLSGARTGTPVLAHSGEAHLTPPVRKKVVENCTVLVLKRLKCVLIYKMQHGYL